MAATHVPFEPYYPGDDQVEWLALDGYNWGRRRRWRALAQIRRDLLRAASRRWHSSAPDKPMMLAEIGCTERGGDKAAWMREALLDAIPDRYPAVQAVVWFNQHRRDHADWRVDSSSTALDAWRQAAADPRYCAQRNRAARRVAFSLTRSARGGIIRHGHGQIRLPSPSCRSTGPTRRRRRSGARCSVAIMKATADCAS